VKYCLFIYFLKRQFLLKKRKKRAAPTNVARAVVNIRPDTVLPDRSVSVASSGANERDQLESAINKVNKIIEEQQLVPRQIVHAPNLQLGHAANNRTPSKFRRSKTNLLPVGNVQRNPLPIAHDLEHKSEDEARKQRAADDLRERKEAFQRKAKAREEEKQTGFSSAPPQSESTPGKSKAELHKERQKQRRQRRGGVESLDPSSSHASSQLDDLRRRDQGERSGAESPQYPELPDQSMGEYRSPKRTSQQNLDTTPEQPIQRELLYKTPQTIHFFESQPRDSTLIEQQQDDIISRLIDESKRPLLETGQQSGSGKSSEGLYDDQINKIMSRFKDYHGTIMRDEIKKLLPSIMPQSRVAFIINTDTHDKPGMHWCAIYIDGRNGPESSNSLEWYDSFARPMPHDIREDCKLILKILKPETILKLKENSVVQQNDNTANCGYFACRFLIDRFRGQSFASATGYDDKMKHYAIEKNEKEIERLKNTKPFNYILAE